MIIISLGKDSLGFASYPSIFGMEPLHSMGTGMRSFYRTEVSNVHLDVSSILPHLIRVPVSIFKLGLLGVVRHYDSL